MSDSNILVRSSSGLKFPTLPPPCLGMIHIPPPLDTSSVIGCWGNGFGVNPSFPVGSLTIAANWHTQWVDMGCGLGMAQPLATPNPQPYSIIDAGVGLFLGLDNQMLKNDTGIAILLGGVL